MKKNNNFIESILYLKRQIIKQRGKKFAKL